MDARTSEGCLEPDGVRIFLPDQSPLLPDQWIQLPLQTGPPSHTSRACLLCLALNINQMCQLEAHECENSFTDTRQLTVEVQHTRMTCGHSGRGSCCGLRGDPISPFDQSEQMGTEELLSVLECDAEVWRF